jgi:hypothetical protein
VLTTSGQKDNVLITMPSTVLAIALTVDVAGGLCFDAYCSTPGAYTGFAGSINPSGAWSINIGPLAQNNGFTKIDNFNAAMAGTGGSETPEVGTLLLIGSGLIAMRWMRRLPRRRRVFQVPQTA